MSKSVIKAENLSKSFYVGKEEYNVIKDMSFTIDEGEFVSIMGPSGCGKSTLLYMLGALEKPDKGNVYIYGKDYNQMNAKELAKMKRSIVGFVFQFYNLVPNLTVEENILLPLMIDKRKDKSLMDRYHEILEMTEIENKTKHTPRELSGGQQQRVAIARALMINPKVLFADEPIGNLDTKTGQKIMQLFVDINKKYKTTIIQVTHSEEAALYGDSILRIRDGAIQDRVNVKKSK